MTKRTVLDLPIRLYQPMQDGDPYLAVIGTGKTIVTIVKGDTPMQAQMKAEAWRKEEYARVKNIKSEEAA